jgi:hypothetical protein
LFILATNASGKERSFPCIIPIFFINVILDDYNDQGGGALLYQISEII